MKSRTDGRRFPWNRSLSSWRAWIEIKVVKGISDLAEKSLSSWRAWIEICRIPCRSMPCACRSPHGERGLKFNDGGGMFPPPSRSPHGERGLKSKRRRRGNRPTRSLSSWRAWIEITASHRKLDSTVPSLSSWRAWIEIARMADMYRSRPGRSPHGERGLKSRRGAPADRQPPVALLMESVD